MRTDHSGVVLMCDVCYSIWPNLAAAAADDAVPTEAPDWQFGDAERIPALRPATPDEIIAGGGTSSADRTIAWGLVDKEGGIVINDVLPPRPARYGVHEPFAQGSRLQFPDFALIFLGGTVDGSSRRWDFQLLDHGDDLRIVVLHSGGVISPEVAEVGGRHFSISLVQGASAGAAEVQLIVTEAAS